MLIKIFNTLLGAGLLLLIAGCIPNPARSSAVLASAASIPEVDHYIALSQQRNAVRVMRAGGRVVRR